MVSSAKLDALKAERLKPRHQRIRRSTYTRVAEAMIEDATLDQPFRHRLVIDWWNRVVDPLEAEKFDAERLRYFRSRLQEHRKSAAHNAAMRQGTKKGKPLRRLNPTKLAYVHHQVRRMANRGLNYAAAAKAVADNDQAYEHLALGLVRLPRLRPTREGWLRRIADAAVSDRRWHDLVERVRADPDLVRPGFSTDLLDFRLSLLTDPSASLWPVVNDPLTYMRYSALIRKLEDEYLNEI